MTNPFSSIDRFPDLLKTFAFPLNVYAWCLYRETGRVGDLHYGFFEHPHESVELAQRRATDCVFRMLPESGRILEIGVGLGTTLKRLLDTGFVARGITPENQQAHLARILCGDEQAVELSSFEAFDNRAGQWDILLFQESSQYIESRALFAKASSLLTPMGEVLVADEFALTNRDDSSLHQLSEFKEHSGQSGFQLVAEYDASDQAAFTVDFLLTMLEKHKLALLTEIGLTEAQLQQLYEANQAYQRNYREGCFGYWILKFRLDRIPEV